MTHVVSKLILIRFDILKIKNTQKSCNERCDENRRDKFESFLSVKLIVTVKRRTRWTINLNHIN